MGKTILISYNFLKDDIKFTPCTGEDSDLQARALWEDIKGDFPGYCPIYLLNKQAKEEKKRRGYNKGKNVKIKKYEF